MTMHAHTAVKHAIDFTAKFVLNLSGNANGACTLKFMVPGHSSALALLEP